MVVMADDHYALDTRLARQTLGWEARHRFKDELPAMVKSLKDDPAAWYKRQCTSKPPWLEGTHRKCKNT